MPGQASKDLRNQAEYKRNRKRLLEDNPTCYLCGVNQATEADHVLEADAGGTNDMSNLAPICRPCNARKGQRYRVLKERQQAGNLVAAPKTTESVFYGETMLAEMCACFQFSYVGMRLLWITRISYPKHHWAQSLHL